MIDELYELSKKAIASGIHVSFEIGLAGYPCRVWVEEPTESKMTAYDIYREEVMMKESVKNYEAAREYLTRLLKEKDPESWGSSGSGVQMDKIVYHPFIVEG